MLTLTNKLPDKVKIGGKEVPINTDFRASVSFAICVHDPNLTDEEKILKGLELYYPTRERDIYDIEEAVNKMLWFFRCGDETKPKGGKQQARAYDFEKDADSIYASFMMQYGVDLSSAPLHWWLFMAMLQNLKEDVPFSKIMTYRVIDTKGMSKEQAAFYRKMKRLYRLEEKKTDEQEEFQKKLEDVLAHGGDISEVLHEKTEV